MKTAIRYYSRTGNTKKLADAIAEVTGTAAETVDIPLGEPVDILFLGSAVYAAGVDSKVKVFIESLDNSKVKKIVCFSTAAVLSSTYAQISKLAKEKGITLDEREFHCRGKFTVMHRGRPNKQDLAQVQQFAKMVLGSN